MSTKLFLFPVLWPVKSNAIIVDFTISHCRYRTANVTCRERKTSLILVSSRSYRQADVEWVSLCSVFCFRLGKFALCKVILRWPLAIPAWTTTSVLHLIPSKPCWDYYKDFKANFWRGKHHEKRCTKYKSSCMYSLGFIFIFSFAHFYTINI